MESVAVVTDFKIVSAIPDLKIYQIGKKHTGCRLICN